MILGKAKKILIKFLIVMMLSFSTAAISGVTPYTIAEAAVKSPGLKVVKKTLYVGYHTYAMEFKNLSSNAKVQYKTSNVKIASVSSKGVVKPITPGVAKITAKVNQNSKTYNLVLTISVSNPKISLTKSVTKLGIGKSFMFTAKVVGLDDKVAWSVSDKALASISSKGKMTALKSGNVTVYAKAGKKIAKVSVKLSRTVLTSTEIYSKCIPNTVEIEVDTDTGEVLGSGFFIGDGKIVTNYHVIAGATKIVVTTSDKKEYEIKKIAGYDAMLDLAVLKLDIKHDSLVLNTNVVGGEDIYTLGSPLGLSGTMSKGMVSTPSRVIDDVEYIQIDAPISHGNSGGPLVNKYGEVIGVNTLYADGGQNLNFAISIKELKKIDISKPATIEEFHKTFVDLRTLWFKLNAIKEDPTVSQDFDNCQDVSPGYYLDGSVSIEGTLKSSETGDCYYIEPTEDCSLIGILQSDTLSDLKNTYFDLRTYSGDYVGGCLPNEADLNEVMVYQLQKGVGYIIIVDLPDGYTGPDINYMFGVYYE